MTVTLIEKNNGSIERTIEHVNTIESSISSIHGHKTKVWAITLDGGKQKAFKQNSVEIKRISAV